MKTTDALTAEFEHWLESVRESAHPGEWEQVMHNIIASAQDELAQLPQ